MECPEDNGPRNRDWWISDAGTSTYVAHPKVQGRMKANRLHSNATDVAGPSPSVRESDKSDRERAVNDFWSGTSFAEDFYSAAPTFLLVPRAGSGAYPHTLNRFAGRSGPPPGESYGGRK